MSLVSAAKPGVSGGIFMGPKTATLPTDATTTLNSAFKSAGYVSDAGVTRAIAKDNTVVNAWGGDVVAIINGNKTETFHFVLMDNDNLDVLGLTFGEATGTMESGITVKSTSDQSTPHAYVIETILSGNVLQRIVIPEGVLTDIGDIVYVDNEVVGFDLTITAISDSDGVTAYTYIHGATGATGATN